MTKGIGFRPSLLPPRGRRLERSKRPFLTCFAVSFAIGVLIFVVCGLTAYNIRSNWFGHKRHDYHIGDMVSLTRTGVDLSSVLCSSYTVETQKRTKFYLLPKKASLDRTAHENVNFSLIIDKESTYTFRYMYLLENSTVNLTACRHVYDSSPADILVIVGQQSAKDWESHPHDHRIAFKFVHIPQDSVCDNTTTLTHLDFEVPDSNQYLFVLTALGRSRHSKIISEQVNLTGAVTRTQYDVHNAVATCNMTESSCQFTLSFGSHMDVVAKVTDSLHEDQLAKRINDPEDKYSVYFMTHCDERVIFWVGVFAVLPVVMMILVSLCCTYILIIRRDQVSWYRQPEISNTNSHIENTSYGAIEETAPLVSKVGPSEHLSDDEACASIQD